MYQKQLIITTTSEYLDIDLLQLLKDSITKNNNQDNNNDIPELETIYEHIDDDNNNNNNNNSNNNYNIEFTQDPIYGKIPLETKVAI